MSDDHKHVTQVVSISPENFDPEAFGKAFNLFMTVVRTMPKEMLSKNAVISLNCRPFIRPDGQIHYTYTATSSAEFSG